MNKSRQGRIVFGTRIEKAWSIFACVAVLAIWQTVDTAAVAAPPAPGFTVTMPDADGTLNVRATPGTQAEQVGVLANRTQLVDMGGCAEHDGETWCKIAPRAGNGPTGWVVARFLKQAMLSDSATPPPTGPTAISAVRRVSFSIATQGTQFSDRIPGNSATVYLLRARNEQDFFFELESLQFPVAWQVFAPNGETVADSSSGARFIGQLTQEGDHQIKIINTTAQTANIGVTIGLQ